MKMEDLEIKFFAAMKINLGFANGYNLDFVKTSLSSSCEGDPPKYLNVKYVIPSSKIGLNFSLSLSSGELLNAHIENNNGDTFCLDEYLRRHGMTTLADKLFDISEDLETSLKLIFEIFNNELNDIITGKKWENIPFDWTGYK
jgi:hypothetical protein